MRNKYVNISDVTLAIRVCNIRPLFQIRIFGYFSRQIRISGFYPDFFVQVRIGPYIPFGNCKWHRRCRPTDKNWNAAMPKRLRDDVMCFRLQIHSRWMMKTHWRAQSQRTHSVRRSDTRTPRTIQVDYSGQESLRINIQKHCIHRRATTWVRRSNAARHSTALDNHRVLFRHSVHVYVHWSNGSLDKTD